MTSPTDSNQTKNFDGISLDGFIVWVKSEYDKNPKTRVSVEFLLEVLKPSLLKEATNE